MTTSKLDRPLKRELEIAGAPYVVTITPDGMTVVLKGKRKGFELNWAALVSGDAAIATALNASLTANLTANKLLPLTNVCASDQEASRKTARAKRKDQPQKWRSELRQSAARKVNGPPK